MRRWLPGQASGWRNWAGNQSFHPAQFEHPLTEGQIQALVRHAGANGQRVKAVASGHSFTGIAGSDDVMVSLEHMNLVRSVDQVANTITVDGGMELRKLNQYLAKLGLALTNLGDIAYQSIAGATSTGTHGTGLSFGGMATQIVGLRLVTATGEIIECNADENAELFECARVGLGALGIITQMTLAVEPAFNLHAIEEPRPIPDVLATWAEDVATHDHYEFFWIPGTDVAVTKTNRRTDEAAQPLSKAAYGRDKILGENIAFGAACRLAALRPSAIPKLTEAFTAGLRRTEYVDASYKVFASPRWVKFVEMEYSVPVTEIPTVVERIGSAVAEAGIDLTFPVEARSSAADDIPLSTSTGRESGYVAVHQFKGQPYQQYFELVEAIVDEHGGRPHWGKMHFQTAATLAPRYPQWDRFQRVRAELDPTGLFANDYTDRVLGKADPGSSVPEVGS